MIEVKAIASAHVLVALGAGPAGLFALGWSVTAL